MSRIGKLHEISRIDQALAENEARITRQREIISGLNPLSRAAKRAKTLLYVFLFAQAECERQRQALLALLSDDELPKPK